MRHDKLPQTIADNMVQTVPMLYRWAIRPDDKGMSPYSPTSSVLKVVKKQGPLPMTAIANALFYSKQSLTTIVDQLVKEGLVERVPDSSDRRVLNIALTEKGRAFITKHKEGIRTRLVDDLSNLTEEELKRLSDAFEVIKDMTPKILKQGKLV